MRTFLVALDDTEECIVALRYAAHRAAATGGAVQVLAIIPQQEFVQWSGVQATMEEEARLRAEAMIVEASGTIFAEVGIHPSILVKQGDPVKVVSEALKDANHRSVLVLAAAGESAPGPLVTHFASVAGSLPCPLMIVPRALHEEALQTPA